MIFCRHIYAKISEAEFESKAEQAKRLGFQVEGIGLDVFDKKHVLIMQCTKCGKIKKIVTRV